MQISFSLKRDGKRPRDYLSTTTPGLLYYEAYFADVEIRFNGNVEKLPNVPMIYFVTALQQLLFEAHITRDKAEADLWDTGHRLSLSIDDHRVVELEIPQGTSPLRFPVQEFVEALRAVTLELLFTMYDDDPRLLSRDLFAKGSIQEQAARLILLGKVHRSR